MAPDMSRFPPITAKEMALIAPDLFRVSPEYAVTFEATFAQRHAQALAALTCATSIAPNT
jgi:hypothetical protein